MTALLVDDNSFAFGDLSHFSLAKSMSSSSIPYHHNLSTTKEASQVHTLSPLFFESFSAVQTFSSSQVSASFGQLPSASPSETTTTTTQSESPSLESQVSQEENAQSNESAAVLRPLFDELRDIEVKFNARRPHPWAMPPKTQADILVEACSLIREHETLLNNLEGLVAQAIAAKQAKRRRRFSNNNNNKSRNSSKSPLPLLPADMESWLPSSCGALHSTLFMNSEISRCVMSATPDMLLLEANNMFLSSPGLSDAARQAVRSGSQQLSLRDWIAPIFLAAIPQIFGGLIQDHHFVLDVVSTPLALTHPDNSLALRSRAILYPSFQDDSHHFSNNNNNNNNEHTRPAKISCINVIVTHRTLVPMTPELLALSANDHFYTSSFLACAHPPKFLVRAFSADFKL